MKKVYGNSAPSISAIKNLAAKFKHGHTLLEDGPREEWPKTATTPETIEKVHIIVLDDRRVKVCEIAEAVGILEERMQNILHEGLGMRKMGTAFAECRSKANARPIFAAMYGPIQEGSD